MSDADPAGETAPAEDSDAIARTLAEIAPGHFLDGYRRGVEAGHLLGTRDVERRVSEGRSVAYAEGRAAAASFYGLDTPAAAGLSTRRLLLIVVVGLFVGFALAEHFNPPKDGENHDVPDMRK